MKYFLATLIAIFALANTYQAHAQTTDDAAYSFDLLGLESFQNGDYKTAESYFRKGSELGSPMSKFYLGIFYMDGIVVQKDTKKGLSLIKEAANMGFYAACYHLAMMHLCGVDVSVDLNLARFWIDKALENGGLENAETLSTGIKFISTNLQKGSGESIFNVGVCYLNGMFDIMANLTQAIKHFTVSANQGYVQAQHNLGYIYGSGDYGITNYPEAIKWYKIASKAGSAESQYNLFIHYSKGVGVAKDVEEAHKWLILAAKNGHPQAIERIKAIEKGQSKYFRQ